MNKLFRILIVHSAKDLFKYKTFFLLIFILVIVDRAIKRFVHIDRSALKLETFKELGNQLASYVFNDLPGVIFHWLSDYRTFFVLIGLFFLKQIISLWPSSDMRRMHRQERGSFGLTGSLIYLRWQQVLLDAVAVSTTCSVVGVWMLLSFGLVHFFWEMHPSSIYLFPLGVLMFVAIPVAIAGFSYSSKLAVISRGLFTEKLKLFLKLFLDRKIFWSSWVFFLFRTVIESLFVVAIPAAVIIFVGDFWIRILVASILATPVYSYLKMASFKFFLEVYFPYDIVREEYRSYYETLVK
jgi:hypothetical protein